MTTSGVLLPHGETCVRTCCVLHHRFGRCPSEWQTQFLIHRQTESINQFLRNLSTKLSALVEATDQFSGLTISRRVFDLLFRHAIAWSLDLYPKLLELPVKGRSRKLENLSAFPDVTGGAFECLHDCFTLDLLHRQQRRNNKCGTRRPCLKFLRQTSGHYFSAATEQYRTLDHAL